MEKARGMWGEGTPRFKWPGNLPRDTTLLIPLLKCLCACSSPQRMAGVRAQ